MFILSHKPSETALSAFTFLWVNSEMLYSVQIVFSKVHSALWNGTCKVLNSLKSYQILGI